MKLRDITALGCFWVAATCVFAQDKKIDPSAVPKDINAKFLSEDLKPEEWVNRFEIESREVYANRKEIVGAIKLKPGDRIADIGAGTGLFIAPFANVVGPQGKVFAVDISPKLIDHMNKRIADEGLTNVNVKLSKEKSAELASASVDVVFVCDTYHHFEHYKAMLSSIFGALRPGGQLIVIEFERLPEVSREWVLGHVRAGKETFTSEIIGAGFRLVEEVKITGFKENYFLRFERP